jgi:methionine synthase II (cobalamin-independent)
MPHADADEACRLVLRYIPDIPAWPQLPQRSFKEGMFAQYSEGFPALKVDSERAYVDQGEELESSLEQLYTAYSENDSRKYVVSEEYAAGLHAFLSIDHGKVRCVKGQITGPVTWGMSAVNREGLPIIYDETMADAVPMFLRLKAAWQENVLRGVSDVTIMFVDEPSLSFLGTAGTALSDDQVVDLMERVLGGISGLKGTHCCGAADWSLLLRTSVDILNFDAYNYAESLSLYPAEVKGLFDRGGSIAWGIVPSDEEVLPKETVASLRDRLEEAMAPFTRAGLRFGHLIEQGLLTPSCGLGSLSPEAAEQALELLADLSAEVRRRYIH